MSKNEWFKKYLVVDDFSGGSEFGKNADRRTVVSPSRFGEVSCKTTEGGELMVNFPEIGVGCIYLADGSLGGVMVELSLFLGLASEDVLSKMVNTGKDIKKMMADLFEAQESLVLGLYPQFSMVRVSLMKRGIELSTQHEEGIDFKNGFLGEMVYNNTSICYKAISNGDELRLSIGEQSVDGRTLIPISISHFVGHKRIMKDGKPESLWKMADKIILSK